jgi:hypothetical protein
MLVWKLIARQHKIAFALLNVVLPPCALAQSKTRGYFSTHFVHSLLKFTWKLSFGKADWAKITNFKISVKIEKKKKMGNVFHQYPKYL